MRDRLSASLTSSIASFKERKQAEIAYEKAIAMTDTTVKVEVKRLYE